MHRLGEVEVRLGGLFRGGAAEVVVPALRDVRSGEASFTFSGLFRGLRAGLGGCGSVREYTNDWIASDVR